MKRRIRAYLKRVCFVALAVTMCLNLSVVSYASSSGITEDIKAEYCFWNL